MNGGRQFARRILSAALVGWLAGPGVAGECPFRQFGTAYYPEDRLPEQWAADLDGMAELGFNVVRIGEFNWSGFEPREGEFDFKPYRDFLDLCQAKGFKVLMCTPTAAMPRWLAKRYPDVRKVRTDGTRPANGLRLDYCASSDRYREFARRIVTKLAEAFRDHPAVCAWQIDNEIHPRAGTGTCVCPACEKGFRAALRKRYGTIENLNRSWHGSFWSGLFNDWDEITLPLGERLGWKREYVRYQGDAFLSFALEQRDILRRVNPKWTITQNTWSCSGEFRLDELFRQLDCVTADTYLWWREDRLDYRRWQISTYRGLSGRQRPFTVGETGPFFADASISNSYEAVKCWDWELVARGAESIYYFCWNTSVSGEELSVRILPWSERKGRAYRAVREFAHDIALLPEPLALQPLGKPSVAIVHDAEAAQYHAVEGGAFGEYFWNVHKRLHNACERFGVQPDVVQFSEDMDLSPYRIVFLPPCERWGAKAIARLKDFVRGGGVAVAVTHQNYLTEGGSYVKEPWPVGMTDLYGLEVVEQRRLCGADSKPVSVPLDFAAGPFSADGHVESADPGTAQVLERFSSTCYAGDPLLTVNSFGRGRAWYLACGADTDGFKALVRRVFRESGLPTDREWPRSVARIVRGPYVVLTNFSTAPAVIPSEAGRLVFGTPCPCGDGRLRLPPFGVAVFQSVPDNVRFSK